MMNKNRLTAIALTALIVSGCAAPTKTAAIQTTVSETCGTTAATSDTETSVVSTTATKKAEPTTAETTTTVIVTEAEEPDKTVTTTADTTAAEIITADSADTSAKATTTTEVSATTTEAATSAAAITESLDEKLTERTRIQITRDNILFDYSRASADNTNEKKAARYINDSSEYTLEIPKALAEFVQKDDRIIIRAYVEGEKLDGKYASYLAPDGFYTDHCCTVDKNENGVIDEEEMDDAIFSRMYLLNGFLVIRNDKLMLDDTLAALGLTLDDMSYDKEAYDTFKKVYTDYERKSIYYGLYGGYNKYDEASRAYEYRDGMSLAELVELMKRVRTEKLLDKKEADELDADVEWDFWVTFATGDNGVWIEATVL